MNVSYLLLIREVQIAKNDSESNSVINQKLHLHKFHIKTIKITPTCFDLFQTIIRELCFSLLKLYYNIHNLIRFCKHGVVAACHVVWECAVESAAGWVCVVCYVMRDWLWVTWKDSESSYPD